ncbi:MAG: TetR/AcrR family transcriptional regulator [Alkalinema sp. RU_4_3]|nr:TetR/AcrR family transcriptional regulator [Alkalinema sp. RU_4_3]
MLFQRPAPTENETRSRILKSAMRLFAKKGFDGTTTKELAEDAGVAEGTLFRHFANKKAILIEVATQGWIDLLTDLLTEFSEMGSYKAVAEVMKHRMMHMRENVDLLRVCFIEVQFHEDLRDRIQQEVIEKMTDVAEAFFQTAMDQGIYRQMDPRLVARVFLGMFTIASFSQNTIADPDASPEDLKAMAEGLADIFLNGVLAPTARA